MFKSQNILGQQIGMNSFILEGFLKKLDPGSSFLESGYAT